jgi:hypothetical protein
VPFSGFACQAGQHVDVPSLPGSPLCARAVPIIAILLAGWRATSGSMHPTDTTAPNRDYLAERISPGSKHWCLRLPLRLHVDDVKRIVELVGDLKPPGPPRFEPAP